jgi:signal transduction histidine kinase
MTTYLPVQRALAGLLLVGPYLLFAALRLVPAWDPTWNDHIFHFYIVSYSSLVALVVANFVMAGVGTAGVQAMFVGMAFMAMAGLFLLHGLATPGMLMSGGSYSIGLSARLSLTTGAVFLALAVRKLNPAWERWITDRRRTLWLGLALAYAVYVAIISSAPEFIETLAEQALLSALLALVTVGLLLWAAWRAWQLHRQSPRRLPLALTFALPWLALAQLSQYLAPTWMLSWWLYHILMLAAFAVAMGALVLDYEHVLDFRLTRYFTALSVIVGVPLVAMLSEAAVRLSGSESARWPMFGFSALAVLFLFLMSLLVVRRAESILNERATALERERQWRIDFTNLLVHDLKSPLSVVWISLSLVLSGRVGQMLDNLRVHLERAQRGSKETLELVDNLLDIEKLEAGALRLTPVACDIATLLRQSLESVRGLAEVFNLRLDAAIADNLPALAIDEALLRRVLQNLLTNAIKFTPPQGQISLAAVGTPAGITVSVTDSGPGVPYDQREHIFEKFVQVTGTERRGVGLGLTLCKLAIEAHGGRIWVEDAPDGGNRFAFTLSGALPVLTR